MTLYVGKRKYLNNSDNQTPLWTEFSLDCAWTETNVLLKNRLI
jgi:hypothetical protein